MKDFTVIKKGTKLYVHNDLFGDMMIYSIKKDPYVRRLSEKIYLTEDLKKELAELA